MATNSLDDLLKKKADQMDFSAKKSALDIAQKELERFAPEFARVSKITDEGAVYVVTPHAPMASNLRFQQVEIIESIKSALNQPIEKLVIQIRS
ncbi:DUF721 domain-containing protein [Candidatus Saccharibacteria bacterium CPR2]|nr:DUF721 domain-containing protein [Candidatus Saccharibacteria bacterium CPR2]